MEYRTLELASIAAKGLKNSSFFTKKMDSYAVVSISETTGKLIQKFKTHVYKSGGSNPKWDSPINFTVNEAAVLENRLTLVVKIKGVKMFVDKNLGEVNVAVKDLLEGLRNDGNGMKSVSYELKEKSGIRNNNGVVSFSYKFGEKFVKENVVETVTPYLNARKEKFAKSSGNGFGSSFSSGLFVSDFGANTGGGHASHGGSGHGGGCGGGGHGDGHGGCGSGGHGGGGGGCGGCGCGSCGCGGGS